ncbi:hybrid sensor histidine kinase/response regulator [hot springs metagenome]|uniref:histidine kinase n=1 Tax=hot springs metagenome TaxID=433727 RepID=A0A5J4L1Z0_9ZZZZ
MNEQKQKVLLVDDDIFVREMLSVVLDDKGYVVSDADNGKAALQKYAADPSIDLIITDMNMPEMDGLQLIKELRSKTFNVPIIVLSSNKEIDMVMAALNIGADDYLIKDEFIQDTIDITVKKTLEKQHLRQANLQLITDLSHKKEELENALSYLTAIINTMPDGLLVIDESGKITLANQAISSLFNLSGNAIIGRCYGEVFDESFTSLLDKSRMNRDDVYTADIDIPSNKIVRAVATSIRKQFAVDKDSGHVGSLVIVRDITFEKEVDRMKNDFISVVSHELRTPLTSIIGFTKIIKNRLEAVLFPCINKDDAKVRKAAEQVAGNIDIIITEGNRLANLINNVLDIAKMEEGKMQLKEELCSMSDIIQRAIDATAPLFAQKQLELKINIDDSIPDIIGDGDRLIQVLINILSNAVKFTDCGSVTVRASVISEKDSTGDGKRVIEIAVTDTGIGIAPDDLQKVFEKFKQVGETLTDRPRGTGLGLPICKQIIEYHGGKIWAESEIGKGSCFIFTLPVK